MSLQSCNNFTTLLTTKARARLRLRLAVRHYPYDPALSADMIMMAPRQRGAYNKREMVTGISPAPLAGQGRFSQTSLCHRARQILRSPSSPCAIMSQSLANMIVDNNTHFFEGVEKLLEVWFTRKDGMTSNCDLRKVPR